MNVKERFSDEDALRAHISANIFDYTAQVRARVGNLEEAYKKAIFHAVLSTVLLIVGFVVFGFLIHNYSINSLGTPLFIAGIVLMMVIVVQGTRILLRTNKIINEFNFKLNQLVFPLIFKMFGYHDAEYAVGIDSPHALVTLEKKDTLKNLDFSSTTKSLEASELITEPHNRVQVDDSVVVRVGGRPLRVSELVVMNVNGSGKERRVKDIFEGYFVEMELWSSLGGKTFVSTDGDRRGFAHHSFWNTITSKGVQATELEWNDFEHLLHVFTTDPIEARYILSPDFMQDLYTWWQDKKNNIRIAFIKDKMYLLFPDKRILIGDTVRSIKKEHVQEYLESIALPLLHVLHLIEDVEERFATSATNQSRDI